MELNTQHARKGWGTQFCRGGESVRFPGFKIETGGPASGGSSCISILVVEGELEAAGIVDLRWLAEGGEWGEAGAVDGIEE